MPPENMAVFMNYASSGAYSDMLTGEGSGVNVSFGDGDNSQPKQQRNADYFTADYPGSNSDAMKGYNSPYGKSSIARTIPSSKYLKAAQYLLDEVVSVRKAIKEQNTKKELTKDSRESDGDSKNKSSDPPANGGSNHHESKNKQSELSATEAELQNKLTKLLSMLDEEQNWDQCQDYEFWNLTILSLLPSVICIKWKLNYGVLSQIDRRYRQYYRKMQIVVSSFDVVAGDGAAKPYTALALQTISRHFRCLTRAICDQTEHHEEVLERQDASENSKAVGISRSGLPGSVSVLRAWHRHFLHPYEDSDKIMLARQTGLTRSQTLRQCLSSDIESWHARNRLFSSQDDIFSSALHSPVEKSHAFGSFVLMDFWFQLNISLMNWCHVSGIKLVHKCTGASLAHVEEMYKERAGDAEIDSNSSSEVAPRRATEDSKVEEREELHQNAASEFQQYNSGQMLESKSNHEADVEMEGANKAETQSGMENQIDEPPPAMDNCILFQDAFVQSNDRFSEFASFGSGNVLANGVSLTLGLL
ncbi:hypothetical protein HAX54_035231 [Datura stramonium]|uniref:POX domain-containing protein n=1 Tax=Datura stramonium TaxID=4076 RepID=A0ABS8SF29_DATST|nr:hypothetical protein [Datura stramonium]